ncbi:MAG: glycosyltransferase family 1 protein [Clostridium sp.]|nr:glycosyltransferase family 1 protein [Clostridium sp.]
MKIAFDARGINWYKGTGIGTYTKNLLKNLLSIDSSNKYTIYWSGKGFSEFQNKNTNIKMASKRYHRFFEEYYFPRNIEKDNIDIFHISQNGIGLCEDINCLKVVTIHDLIPYIMPETVGRGYLIKFLKNMPRIIEEVDSIITVSNSSKNDILKFFPVDEDKISVIPLAADDIYKPLDKIKCKKYVSEHYNINSHFILYIGGFSKRKNVHSLIKAFDKIRTEVKGDLNLVICGAKNDDIANLQNMSLNSSSSSNIIFTDYIKEFELPIFYNACTIFVYPSLYEGFGLPPLEAMKCGANVITSNIPSIKEVTEGGAVLIDPLSEDSLKDALFALITDTKKRSVLSKNALIRANEFSWNKTAKQTLDVYNRLIETKSI